MKKSNLKNLTLIALFAALLCASAIIYIPLVVPITLQTLIICLCAELLGTKKTVTVYLVYLIIGLLGLPVFSGFNGGIAALFSNTGGFIIGFLAFILVKGLTKKLFKKGYVSSIISSYVFLNELKKIGDKYQIFIRKGAGEDVDHQAAMLVE